MNATTADNSPKTIRDLYPQSYKDFTEEQLRQHMRIPGSLFTGRQNHALGVFAKGKTYFFGAEKEWANDDEGWTVVAARRRGVNKKWLGAKAAMNH